MLLEFKTSVNKVGHCEALLIDIDVKTFTRNVMPRGVEIKRRDLYEIIRKLKEAGYVEI